ncbi:MAG: hypothetical protein V2J89_09650 [Halieaceae bacterium]|jgi:hypothetical protein|nr:hypothetical protein [Halieaceae bacterium]
MERILYFSGYRMKVFEWSGEELVGSCSFEPDEDGFASFEQYLADAIPLPARLLVDLMKEEFRRENIPHVNVRDRRRLIDRLLERHYREREYVHARVIGRSRSGRRDDQVLISALTSADVLNPWLERMDNARVRLAGIWSLPLITHRLLRPLKAKEEHSLVITRQIDTSLRTTYFGNGKLLLSRQVGFEDEDWMNNKPETVADHIERGAFDVDAFLVNQRLLGSGEHLQVHCVLPEEQLQEVQAGVTDTDAIKYKFSSIEQLHRSFKLRGAEIRSDRMDTLFTYLCSTEPVLRDHYGKSTQKRRFNHYFLDSLITQAAELGTLLFVTTAVLLALNSIQLRQEVAAFATERTRIQQRYEREFETVEPRLNTAGTVRDSVVAVEALQREALRTPQAMFEPLGQVLGDPEFASLQLQRLEWQKYSAEEAKQLLQSAGEPLRTDENPYRQQYGSGGDDEEYDDSGQQGRRAVLQLRGSVTGDMSYATTVARMQAMADRLRALEEVSEVLLLRMPVDVRDRARFTDQLGSEVSEEALLAGANRFELLLLLKEDARA